MRCALIDIVPYLILALSATYATPLPATEAYASALATSNANSFTASAAPSQAHSQLRRHLPESWEWYANEFKKRAKWTFIGKVFKEQVLGWNVIPARNDPEPGVTSGSKGAMGSSSGGGQGGSGRGGGRGGRSK
ncbi:hypothetical protein FRB95_014765 [Tulasnella sp. JGI-2019a]|nr:hypothetical protein FRB95_014765 [Tulasnella sp. JGI-2019a]